MKIEHSVCSVYCSVSEVNSGRRSHSLTCQKTLEHEGIKQINTEIHVTVKPFEMLLK